MTSTYNIFNTSSVNEDISGPKENPEDKISNEVKNASVGATHVVYEIIYDRSGSMLNMYLNANTSGTTSGSLPQGPTANEADIMIGSRTKTDDAAKEFSLAELRMYDYAVSDEGIS